MTAWQLFTEMVEEADQSTCPFCGIRHKAVKASPYCSKATEFKMWLEIQDAQAS